MTASVSYVLSEGELRLRYFYTRRGAVPQHINEFIRIVKTPTQFDGERHWFECPACGKRCRLIYIYGASRFRCRQCHGARHQSQYESQPSRISRRRWRIRRKLERLGGKHWPFALDNGFPPKPRRMRWETYRRLESLDRELAARWYVGVSAWLERTDPHKRAAERAKHLAGGSTRSPRRRTPAPEVRQRPP